MSIIVRNSELSNDTIGALNLLIDADIKAGTAFKLTRIIKELSSIIEDKMKLEKKLLDKYTQKDENGDPTPVYDGDEIVKDAINLTDVAGLQTEMESLMSIENEIPYDKIDFDDLGLETAKVKDLIKLEFLFK